MRKYAIATTFFLSLSSFSAFAWEFDEHALLGTQAYQQACSRMGAIDKKSISTTQQQRLELACMKLGEKFYYAGVYGRAAAVAGDHALTPDDFYTGAAQRYVANTGEYGLLALRNSNHFYPLVTNEWSMYFNQSLHLAMDAQSLVGAEQVRAFERMMFVHAFSSHFYQDAFSAGHMGFNRVGSTSAPALTFHDYWNRQGRRVTNGKGESWLTMGDGCLTKHKQCEQTDPKVYEATRSHAVNGNAAAVESLLKAFVYGQRDAELEMDAWRLMPKKVLVAKDATINTMVTSFSNRHQEQEQDEYLADINASAVVNTTIDTWMQLPSDKVSAANWNRQPTFIGVSVYMDDLFDTVPIRFYLGGEWCDGSIGGFDAGYIAPINSLVNPQLLLDGMISHEVVLGGYGNDVTASGYAAYRANLELGRWYVRFQAGRSILGDYEKTIGEYYSSVGIGFVLRASGGGAR
ncbi:MAG: hypothetical protein OEW58_03485 [Gammaproteobacteria bacterium]|nr:hypothetical protein [Gammaproteobacteria bacterium]